MYISCIHLRCHSAQKTRKCKHCTHQLDTVETYCHTMNTILLLTNTNILIFQCKPCWQVCEARFTWCHLHHQHQPNFLTHVYSEQLKSWIFFVFVLLITCIFCKPVSGDTTPCKKKPFTVWPHCTVWNVTAYVSFLFTFYRVHTVCNQ